MNSLAYLGLGEAYKELSQYKLAIENYDKYINLIKNEKENKYKI